MAHVFMLSMHGAEEGGDGDDDGDESDDKYVDSSVRHCLVPSLGSVMFLLWISFTLWLWLQ